MGFDIEYFASTFAELDKLLLSRIGASYQTRMEAVVSSLTQRQPLYRSCKDRLFLYLFLSKALIFKHYSSYNLHEGARIIPVIANLSVNLPMLFNVVNYEDKISELCQPTNDNIDATLFEILVAIKYVALGFKVEFIPEAPPAKTPDLFVKKNGVGRFVECKKMQRGNLYSYNELDTWYEIADGAARIVADNELTGHIQFRFSSELKDINPKRVWRKIYKKLDICKTIGKPFHLVKNSDFRIKYTPIRSSKFNVELDMMKHISGPSFIDYLIGEYDPNLQYKVICDAQLEGAFVSSVRWASIFTCHFGSGRSSYLKAQHMKRKLVEAAKQLSVSGSGDVHILIEDCHGLNVYEKRLLRNLETMVQFEDRDNCVDRVYIHIAKYIVPLDGVFDVEETVDWFCKEGCTPESAFAVWFPAESFEEGYGTLLEEY